MKLYFQWFNKYVREHTDIVQDLFKAGQLDTDEIKVAKQILPKIFRGITQTN